LITEDAPGWHLVLEDDAGGFGLGGDGRSGDLGSGRVEGAPGQGQDGCDGRGPGEPIDRIPTISREFTFAESP
jgi:hypothetical protein